MLTNRTSNHFGFLARLNDIAVGAKKLIARWILDCRSIYAKTADLTEFFIATAFWMVNLKNSDVLDLASGTFTAKRGDGLSSQFLSYPSRSLAVTFQTSRRMPGYFLGVGTDPFLHCKFSYRLDLITAGA